MKMNKIGYRIGDLAKELNVEKFVIRFWEKELQIKPKRSEGGQRFYQEKDFQTFLMVKELLYKKKFTLAGAKEELLRLKDTTKPSMSEKKSMIIATQKYDTKQYYEGLLSVKNKLLDLQKKLL